MRSAIDWAIAEYVNRLSRRNYEMRKQRLAVFANDWIGINICLSGVYEKDQLELIFNFLSPLEDTFRKGLALDIGANIGNHAVFFDRFFDSIFAFEPNPSAYALLALNANYSKGIKVFNFGLGEINGFGDLYENLENLGGASLKPRLEQEGPPVQVCVRRLDDCQLNLSRLCFMKIDVEGFELQVLRGGLEVIKKHQPVIVFEQLENEFRGGISQAATLLKEMNYTLCWIQNETVQKSSTFRYLVSLLKWTYGGTLKFSIVTDDSLPAATYAMLIAVPSKYHETLGLA